MRPLGGAIEVGMGRVKFPKLVVVALVPNPALKELRLEDCNEANSG